MYKIQSTTCGKSAGNSFSGRKDMTRTISYRIWRRSSMGNDHRLTGQDDPSRATSLIPRFEEILGANGPVPLRRLPIHPQHLHGVVGSHGGPRLSRLRVRESLPVRTVTRQSVSRSGFQHRPVETGVRCGEFSASRCDPDFRRSGRSFEQFLSPGPVARIRRALRRRDFRRRNRRAPDPRPATHRE
jgi:hypothetical protein